jgi:hypothetical protein
MAPVGGDLRAECLELRERFALCVALFGLNGLNVNCRSASDRWR